MGATMEINHGLTYRWARRPVRVRPAIATARERDGSADRNTVLQAALGPQRVQAARHLQRRALANIALKALAVTADRLDDVGGPIVGQPHAGAELALDAEQPADIGIVRLHHVIDVVLIHAELFGI